MLETDIETSSWEERERYWINYYRSNGANLTNRTDGGYGLVGAAQATRDKLSAIRKADWGSPETRQKLLKVIHSTERSRKISAALTGRKKSAEHVAKLPQNQRGRRLSNRHRAAISLALIGNQYRKGIPHSEETLLFLSQRMLGNQNTKGRVMPQVERDQRSSANKGQPKSEEWKAQMRGRTKSPEWREKIRQSNIATAAKKKGISNDLFATIPNDANAAE